VRLLFESGHYSRAAFIELRTEDEEIHFLKEGGVAADVRESTEETMPHLPLQWILSSRNQTPFADVEEDKT